MRLSKDSLFSRSLVAEIVPTVGNVSWSLHVSRVKNNGCGDIEVKYRRINKNEIQCPVLCFSLFLILPPLEPKAHVHFQNLARTPSARPRQPFFPAVSPERGQLEGQR